MEILLAVFHVVLGLAAAPFLLGVVNRTKAFFGGRDGNPFFQPYYDLARLLRKGAVYSVATSWVFRAGPMVGLTCLLLCMGIVPFAHNRGIVSFAGDFVLLVYLLGLARLATVLAALDTGSAFEGMGANREVLFSALAEPAFLLGLAAVARETLYRPGNLGFLKEWALADLCVRTSVDWWSHSGGLLALVLVSWFIVLACENSRIPVDDPTTHLELTMIHEVMVLDHSGPDYAFILYGQALKMWIFASLLVGTLLPFNTAYAGLNTVVNLAACVGVCVATGVLESCIARLKTPRVPQLLVAASALSVLAFILHGQGG